MNRKFNLSIIVLFTLAFTFSGCKHKRVKPKYHNSHSNYYHKQNYNNSYRNQYYNHTQQQLPPPRDMEYPNRYSSSYRGYRGKSNGYGAYRPIRTTMERPKVSHSMSELTRDSANVKPTLVYSYPKNSTFGGATPVNLEPIKYKMLDYINNLREHGTVCSNPSPAINWNRNLENASNMHARDMAVNKFLGHLGSGGTTDLAKRAIGSRSNFYERIIYSGYPVKPGELAGEILTYTKFRIVGNQDPYANFQHAIDNFLRSSRHCQILTNPRFKDVGISAYKDNEKMYWVIEFGEANY
jgi:uncharacterized protein YkwD